MIHLERTFLKMCSLLKGLRYWTESRYFSIMPIHLAHAWVKQFKGDKHKSHFEIYEYRSHVKEKQIDLKGQSFYIVGLYT